MSGSRNATMCKKPERLHILETGGEALGQNNGIISYAPAWKAVPLRLIVLPSRQRGSGCSLIPRASPPVSKMYSLPGLRCNGLYSAAKQSGRIYRTPINNLWQFFGKPEACRRIAINYMSLSFHRSACPSGSISYLMTFLLPTMFNSNHNSVKNEAMTGRSSTTSFSIVCHNCCGLI